MKTMKFLTVILAVLLLTASCGTGNKANQGLKDAQHRAALIKKEIRAQATKDARNEAKKLRKEDYKVFVGALPLDKQLDEAWIKTHDHDENLFPEYVVVSRRVTSGNTSAAQMQALHLAQVELAQLMSTNIAALVEASVANKEITQQEASAINNAIQASKGLTIMELGQTFKVLEIYRDLPNGNVEVMLRVAYSTRMAAEAARRAIQAKLEDSAEITHQKLESLLGWDKIFNPEHSTNTNNPEYNTNPNPNLVWDR